MKIIQKIFLLLAFPAFVFAGSLSLGGVAQAATCGSVQTSIIECEEDQLTCANGDKIPNTPTAICPDNSEPRATVEGSAVWSVLVLAINILTGLVAVAALGGIVWGSILYTSAGGNAEQTKKAMGIITNVVIGIIAYGLMYVGLNFLVPGGVFN